MKTLKGKVTGKRLEVGNEQIVSDITLKHDSGMVVNGKSIMIGQTITVPLNLELGQIVDIIIKTGTEESF